MTPPNRRCTITFQAYVLARADGGFAVMFRALPRGRWRLLAG